ELLAERRKHRPDSFAPLRLRCSSRATELPVIPSCRSLAGGSAPNGRSASSGSKTPWPGTASGPGPISASESGNSINKPKIKFTPGHGLLLQQWPLIRTIEEEPNIKHRTSNVQHPTSNIQHPTSNIQHR